MQRLPLGVRARARQQRLGAQPVAELARGVAPQLEPLGGAAQPVERRGRPVAAPGRGRELLLDAVALGEQRLEPLAGALALEARPPRAAPRPPPAARRSRPGRARRRAPAGAAISPRSFSARSAAVACRASGRSRAFTSASRSRARSTWIRTRASFSSARWRRRLNLPSPAASSISARRSSGFEREDLLDLALADHRAVAAAEADVGEQLDEVGAPHRRAVDQVLALAAAVQPPRDRDLAEVELRQRAVLVVEQQLDLAEVGRRMAGRAREEDVVRLLRAQLVRAQRAGGPEQRVGHVRLARAVRADDDGDARLEANLDRLRERLEAAQLDRSQVHAAGGYGARRMPPRPAHSLGLSHPGEDLRRATLVPTRSGGRSWTCCSTCRDQRPRRSRRASVSPHGQSTHLGHRVLLRTRSGCYAAGARRSSASLAAACSAAFFERPRADPGLLAVDHRRARERAVVRRPLDVEHVVDDLPRPGGRAPPGAPSCGRRGSSARR